MAAGTAGSLGGGRVVVLGTGKGPLACFDADDPARPLWSVGDAPGDFIKPPGDPRPNARLMGLRTARLLDVFPGPRHPGREIVAIFLNDPWSPACVRVHDLAGRVLDEFWHDGHLFHFEHLPRSNLLVFSGVNSEKTWDEIGHAIHTRRVHPNVVFAVQPSPDGRPRGWITPRRGPHAAPAAWYRCLHYRGDATIRETARVETPSLQHGVDSGLVRFTVQPLPRRVAGGEIVFLLNDRGEVVERFANDTYLSAEERPEPSSFVLGDLP